jgi:hypothetical protein
MGTDSSREPKLNMLLRHRVYSESDCTTGYESAQIRVGAALAARVLNLRDAKASPKHIDRCSLRRGCWLLGTAQAPALHLVRV